MKRSRSRSLSLWLAVALMALAAFPVAAPAPRAARALAGTWTQTDWTTPSTTLAVAASGTNQFYRPSTVSTFGQLVGTFGVCAGDGAWCQGSGDTAPGQTLRLAGNHKSDQGNLYSSDLNADGVSELLFANFYNGSTFTFDGGYIYWGGGAPNNPSWSAASVTTLPTLGAHHGTVADLNGDGRPEVIFVNHRNDSTSNVNSYIYWGQVGGTYGVTYSTASVTTLPTLGATGVAVADLNSDGRPEVIFANWTNGSTYNINSYIYWGQAGGTYGVTYSTAFSTTLPTSGAEGVAVADLNGDGRPEVIFANVFNNSTYNVNSHIYWGQAGGTYGVTYSTAFSTTLPTSGAVGVAVADLNGDGRPEVIFANWTNGSTFNVNSYIYWGQASGPYGVTYSTTARTDLPGVGAMKASVADVNNDGQLDVVVQNHHGGFTRVFWGLLPGGGTATISWTLPITFGFRGLSLSDLNADGHIDLLTGQQGAIVAYPWAGGTSGRVYLHTGNNAAPYSTTPNFDLPVRSSMGAYASFGPGRGTNGDSFSQPRPVYGTAFPNYGVLESMVMDSGQDGSAWTSVTATTQISPGTGITLFVAASDNLAALSNPTWVQVGALGNGAWLQALSSVSGRYARYRAVLWRDRTTEASPALQDITFAYETIPQQGYASFSKIAPTNGATGQPLNGLNLSWTTMTDATSYQICYDTTLNSVCNGSWQSVGNVGSATLNGLTPNTTYEWQVRACNAAGCNAGANNGAWWRFTTLTGPGAFSKSSPSNGATGQSVNPTLSWGAPGGTVDHYRYCYATTIGCTPNTTNSTATNVTLTGLAAGTTYYWQVRACAEPTCAAYTDANGGAHWSFTTAAAVGSFNKLAPGNSAINVNPATASLQWGAAANATGYALCVGTAVNNCNVFGGGVGQFQSVGNVTNQPLSSLGLQPNTTYYWQVLASNGVFTTSADGSALAFWSFTTLPNGPDPFNKLSPSFNATNVPTQNVTFQWQAASGAVSYTLCVGAFAGDCSYSVVVNSGTSAVLAGPLPAGATLVWQVTAHNAGGSTNADNGAWWPFTTLPNAPQAFSKLNPPDNATGQPLGVNLTWQDTSDEDDYTVCVGTAIGLCNLVYTTTAQNVTNYALTGLTYGTQYYWQVSACNTGGCTPANNGVSWGFKTLNPPLPGPFQKTTPANGAGGVSTNPAAVLLKWTAAAQADGYEVCMGTAPGTCDLSGGGFQDVGSVTSRLISQLPFAVTLQPATTYYWQVRAYNNLTATRTFADGGVDFHFSTLSVSGPGDFSKDAPVNGSFNLPTASLTLRWFAAAGATSYEVCAGSAPGLCNAMPGNTWLNVGNALSYALSGLNPGSTYYWQVRAVNSGGSTAANNGAWWSFSTQNNNPPAEFSKQSPPHLAVGVPTGTATLSWTVSTGATGYEVCVGSAPGQCEASGGWVNVGSATSWTPPALNAATTYWWQVRALGASFSVQANGGQWWAFTTVSDAPPAPGDFGKLQPLQGASGRPTATLQLSWQPAVGATGYQVCIGTQAGLCDVTGSWVNAGNVAQWNAPTLSPATTYWWQVRAVNGSGQAQADGGTWWYFTTASPSGPSAPTPFGKSAPANAASNQPVNPTLSWAPAAGASGYQVCVGVLPGDCSATGGWANATGEIYNAVGLSHDTTYWWQVRAFNAGGQTLADGGVWWRFSTGNNPASPMGTFGKSAPAHTAIGVATNATLSWGSADNAQRYTVCVGTQPGLCDVMSQVEVLSPTTSLALANAQAGRTYWWQVWAYRDANLLLADAGQWWAFTTANDTSGGPGSGPADFTKVSPPNASATGSLVTLQWNDTDANEYRVCVGTAWGLCDAVNNVRISPGGFVINAVNAVLSYAAPRLTPGTYWWQVTALGVDGDATQADGGQRWQFTVLDDGVSNLNTSGATGTRKEVTPTQVRMGDLVSYTIVLSNSGSLTVTAQVTDTLAVSATLVSATPGYAQSGQTLVWNSVNVPAFGTAVLTVTVRAGSGPLPGGYVLNNSVTVGAHDGQITRSAPGVTVEPHRAFVPIVIKP